MSNDGTGRTPEQIEAEIAAQRGHLSETVSELQDKLDVKRQARRRLTGPDGRPRPELLTAAAGLVGLVVLLVVRRRRRR